MYHQSSFLAVKVGLQLASTSYNMGSKVSLYYSIVLAITDSQTIGDLHGGSPSCFCLPPQALLARARE